MEYVIKGHVPYK